ncbi:MAG: type II toxin-antitoxin system RelE/ParE family toxin [Candidatus Lambdaproteobacteria bacterium]|nr:type II toxin-antitoxin system RelE/ParE family toxin [Candidatus Lambdaproteobacteria bacterium]
MGHAVFLTRDAAQDLEQLFEYLILHDAPKKAEHVLARIEKALDGLSELPERGAYPRELLTLGIHEYREVFFKPYRIIYRIVGDRVYVMVIADGRRDMQTLLQRRLLGG